MAVPLGLSFLTYMELSSHGSCSPGVLPLAASIFLFRDEETETQRGSSWATSAWQPTGRAAGACARRTPGPAEWQGGTREAALGAGGF